MRLIRTYERPDLHLRWQGAYRTSSVLALDARVYEWISTRVQAAKSWLDAGCGYGERTVFLARRSLDVTAVDVSPLALENATATIAAAGLSERVRFYSGTLEELRIDRLFQNVHCRGVLMHIPDWKAALGSLCASLERGGHLVIFENDMVSIEAALVVLARSFFRTKSRLLRTADGLEFWSRQDGLPFVVRMANLRTLRREMAKNGVRWQAVRPTAVVDPNRLPASLRALEGPLNALWFAARLPLGSAVVIIGRKE
jgi:SAM-dependent methyltransferase